MIEAVFEDLALKRRLLEEVEAGGREGCGEEVERLVSGDAGDDGGDAEVDCTSDEVLCIGLVTDVGEVDDKSFNQSAWEGVEQAAAGLGIGEDDITDVRDVYRVVGGHAPGDEVVVSILRDRQPQMLRLALGSAPDSRQAQAMHPHAMHGYGHGFKHGEGIGYRHGHDGFHGYNKNSGCHVGKMLRPS